MFITIHMYNTKISYFFYQLLLQYLYLSEVKIYAKLSEINKIIIIIILMINLKVLEMMILYFEYFI